MVGLSGWHNGIIGLEKHVIDLSRLQIRRRATAADLERYYTELLRNAEALAPYFADEQAFEQTIDDLLVSKKPELVARNPVYPHIFSRQPLKDLVEYASSASVPKTRYFYTGTTRAAVPLEEGSPFSKLIGMDNPNIKPVSLDEYNAKPWATIEVPNDMTATMTKVTLAHEMLHLLIVNYQLLSKRLLTDGGNFSTQNERFVAENLLQENVVRSYTDALLGSDKEALFEHRWLSYASSTKQFFGFLQLITPALTGVLFVMSFNHPLLVPTMPVPEGARRVMYMLYKNSKKGILTLPAERAEFKI